MNKQRPTLSLKSPATPAAPKLRASHARDLKPALQTGFNTGLKPDSLAYSLIGAAQAVALVRTGTNLPQALVQVWVRLGAGATPQARGAMQDISYRCMRQLGQSETLVGLMAPKAPEPLVAALLACALALINAPDETAPYEEFTVVDQTVTAAEAHPDTARAKGMVNAVLRRFLRERQTMLDTASLQPLARWNYPQWWIDAVRAAWPQDWQGVLTTGNTAPPLTLRVNVRKSSVEDYLAVLEQAGMAATRIGPSAVRLVKPVAVGLIPGFNDGVVSVQDAGAQLAAPLLDLADGMRVLDACAAPGGKTCHILELAKVHVTALDADAKRLARVGENLERLQLDAELTAAPAEASDWWDGQPFDRILADVPCTASGIVRRHPDIRWLRRKGDTLQLATLSAKILDNLWQMLAPGGKLLFVTCSLWPQESEAQAAAFAVRHGAARLDAPGQLLPAGGDGQDHDGLFYALFQKNA
ncbi:16S rRNA (cytosine967-C5)-methyltransferase [Duganella sp. 3397]|uniref:16S rRNA (cytosine(967)-C(5))-methyltransferase RsmB n=1 Tax=Duganella sp. 3397 TaxID=2817732 RepID=UPI00285770C5|nr:16S rRNA (cytosine(967)-C(5))-methyltransferase RsmB [Duganella sp. 3397]MDR7051783.1 16S rRNA (cytosine967-C5)-methyltransferase [Duganella sp. 3397]